MKNYVIIQLEDICYYDDDFSYDPFIVERTDDFEQKYKELLKVCNNYEFFQEIEDFINENFKKVQFEKRVIKI